MLLNFSLKRFEKTNEMLRTCVLLTDKRLEKIKIEFATNREIILQAKSDLEYIFQKIRIFKQILSQKHPAIYEKQS